MKKTALIFFVVAFCFPAFSQTTPFKRYYVQFTNKNNSPYSIDDPSAYLSARAINRRHTQNIPIDSLDLPVNPPYLDSVASTGAVIMNPTKWLNGVTISTDDSNVLLKIQAFPFVKKSSPVSTVNVAKMKIKKNHIVNSNSNTPSASERSSLFNYGYAFNQINMINGTGLHEAGYQGQGMVIASLDDGWYNANNLSCFDSIFGTNRFLGSRDFVNENDTDIFSLDTHGCETFSTMAAYLPGQIIGTAPFAGYWLLRTENDTSENPIELYNWVSGAEFADSVGADILTSSLGYSTFDDGAFNFTYADMNGKTAPCSIAATIAASKGMIVCNSAGNEGDDSWMYITAPGDADSILTIGAVDQNGNYAPYSGIGPTSDGRIKPDVVAQGSSVAIISPNAGTATLGYGTSFACPIIAGMTACLWQEYPTKTNKQIIQAVKQSASLYTNPNYFVGYGIPNYGLASVLLSSASINTINQSTIPYVYPNPFSEQINLIYDNDNSGTETLKIYDVLGRLVYNNTITATTNGFHNYKITGLNSLSGGVYTLVISNSIHQQQVKIVKL